jgi:hypothetical protein
MHRAFSRWQGVEVPECGPDVTALLELTPIGYHEILARRRFSSPYAVWQVSDAGVINPMSTVAGTVDNGGVAGFALLPGPTPHVFDYDPRSSQWIVYASVPSITPAQASLASPQLGSWPAGDAFESGNGQPWGHQFIGLDASHLLDRNFTDGSTRIWQLVADPAGNGMVDLQLEGGLAGPPRDEFRRGHRLVPLGPGRLLSWLPRPCATDGAPPTSCTGADWNVWTYDLSPGEAGGAPRDPFTAPAGPPGFWSDIGAGHDLLADDANLFVWTRADGRLRSYALPPPGGDPLGQTLDDLTAKDLQSTDWIPPSRAPSIQHLVLILQDGRSFDSYFGQYCTGPTSPDGQPLGCVDGPSCCEAMPASTPGAPACAPLDPTAPNAYAPNVLPDCLRDKMNGAAMDRFAVPPPDGCGNPLDFACAGVAPAAGAIAATYHGFAASGAIADRFFQTYAFVDGKVGASSPAREQNFLYLPVARFADPTVMTDTPSMTKELARIQVSWAVYGGKNTLDQMRPFGLPIFYDPDWTSFHSLEAGELENDIATGQLPTVSIVVPDIDDAARSEAPGHAFDAAIGYVDALAGAIAGSTTYHRNTLVLVADLTAGGFYDHVAPPAAPAIGVDSSSGMAGVGAQVHYGPRVPMLALPPFGIPGRVSHTQLEMTSIVWFIEWNWMHGQTLKGGRETSDPRSYRDVAVNNIGSLIDAVAAGVEVPAGRD